MIHSKISKAVLSLAFSTLFITGCNSQSAKQLNTPVANISSQSVGSNKSITRKFFNPQKSELWKIKTSSANNVSALSTVTEVNEPEKRVDTTNFKYSSRQWHLRSTGTTNAWQHTKGNKDLIVAVIDSGVDYDHPDLKGRVIKGPDFADGDNNPMDEKSGHGTHVAGIIAANGAAKGIAPNVKIMALKVFPNSNKRYQFYNSSEGIADAIIYAVNNGASIINMSLGVDSMRNTGSPRAIQSAITEAAGRGVSIVTAAGNETYGFVSSQPSVQQNPYQIPVIATDERNRISSFSNYSNMDHPKAISAPGVNIFAPVPTAIVCSKNKCDMPYDYKNGTSMAAPVVAGTLALIRSAMYDDYLHLMEVYQRRNPRAKAMTMHEFFHTKKREASWWLGLAIPPGELAEHIMFAFTNKDNSYMHDPSSMSYSASRDPVFGYGIVDIGKAVNTASKVFSEVFL